MSATSRITKATLAAELDTARARISVLEAQLQAERAGHQRPSMNVAPRTTVPVPRPKPVAPQWQQDRAVQMAAARALAMQTGQMIRV